MNNSNSTLNQMIESFAENQKAAGRWGRLPRHPNLVIFYNYCRKNYPPAEQLTQEMIDSWCKKRLTENNNSCASRISVIISFVQYTNSRELTQLQIPETPARFPSTYIPHAFSNEELQKFFDACDNIAYRKHIGCRNRKATIPVFFRLLYSSGIRTTEARLLRVNDVNLETGVLSIRETKGQNQHYVVLHDSTCDMLKQYDRKISKLYPKRTYFFPTIDDKAHTANWVAENFRRLWVSVNAEHATAYQLRHHYAIENINRMINSGFGFHSDFIYLSKSMGHKNLKNTAYYYALAPVLADILYKNTNDSFNNVIPEVKNYENK